MKDKKNLLYNSLRSEDEVDFINKRYEIFMQDTTERKLYKYRAVNKYSLSNLELCIVHHPRNLMTHLTVSWQCE